MPTPSRFPSALRRQDGASEPPHRRQGPSPKEIAMMSADQLRDYYKRTGAWAELDRAAVAESRKTGFVPAVFIRESR